ncbi:uncharacterized protein SCHCODRAFT_02517671 [Schizophyllum commune H4-8]|nr:uncharacterized protein SCHCODRAFT_02517671 [Schizophyllum commune H4-8]KAI5886667.1 hypothetical protein SCHCODRAFT_02517671 [Schizophyllum commune H4-8]
MKPSTSKENGLRYTTEEALQALQLLGAPEISLEDFERLHRGAMGKLLDSIISHMQGRQRVSAARAGIQKRRDQVAADPRAGNKFSKDEPLENLRRATSRLNAAQKSVEVYQDELNARQGALAKSQRELDQVTAELDSKQRSLYLLTSLHELESERTERLKRAKESYDELRARIARIPKRKPLPAEQPASSKAMIRTRKNHTALTLHNLHAYHVHLNSLLNGPGSAVTVQSTRYKSLLPATSNAQLLEDIAQLHEDVTTKQTHLQRLSDMSLSYLVACQKLSAVTSDFTTLAAPALSAPLRAQATDAMGRVEGLRESIVVFKSNDQNSGLNDDDLTRKVKALLKIHGRVGVEGILRELSLATQVRPPVAVFPALPLRADDSEVLAAHYSSTSAHEARAVKLLTRKADKADYGIRILEDLQHGIIEDVRRVEAASHSKSRSEAREKGGTAARAKNSRHGGRK